ncbi:hypothetical protein ACJMK2_030744 [Sinanodonta woodiana]|uniref:Uncharacterized protein n=1 Tax=Sinanodonta woodiana TaxID=1069815 RepID=A0ABD3WYQ4_SINWO
MPTSSQAMILRGNIYKEDVKLLDTNRILPTPTCCPIFRANVIMENLKLNRNLGESTLCELVKFDIMLESKDSENTSSEIEGRFIYNPRQNGFYWVIGEPMKVESPQKDYFQCMERFHAGGQNLIQSNSDVYDSVLSKQHNTSPVTSTFRMNSHTSDFVHEQRQRLEDLGFRRRRTIPMWEIGKWNEKRTQTESSVGTQGPVKTTSDTSSDVRTAYRLCKMSPSKRLGRRFDTKSAELWNDASLGSKAAQSIDNSINTSRQEEVSEKPKKSLIEEVKEKVHWNQRVMPTWKDCLDAGDMERPLTVCFSLRRNNDVFSHADLKKLIAAQIGCKVIALRYDPVSVRTSDRTANDRWFATLEDPVQCKYFIQKGLVVGPDKIMVRSLDDVIHTFQTIQANCSLLPQMEISKC